MAHQRLHYSGCPSDSSDSSSKVSFCWSSAADIALQTHRQVTLASLLEGTFCGKSQCLRSLGGGDPVLEVCTRPEIHTCSLFRNLREMMMLVIRLEVQQWAQSSCLTCHPDFQWTKEVMHRRFWRALHDEDTWEFVNVCIYNQQTPTHQAPVGFMPPLPVPNCPWSHMSLEFVSCLP